MGLLSKLTSLFGGGGSHGLTVINVASRFEILGKTGQGSMSQVFRARDKKLGRMVAVKVLDKVKTQKFEDRFKTMKIKRPTEGVITAILKHKNVVSTFEHGISNKGEQVLVMELIDGMGLNFLIETASPQLDGERVNLTVQMAEGLDFLHKSGYLHRDICPRNIMVTKENVVKYIDFGLSIPFKPEFLKPGNRTGTTEYLAPELIKRAPTDQRVDLFALGVTCYELFTGTLPWEKTHDSMQTLRNHVNMKGKDPREIQPALDKSVAEFLMKSIERQPRDRFQTAEAFRDAAKTLPAKY